MKVKVLFADDEVGIRKLLTHLLSYENYQIFEASTGKEAIQLASLHQPDIILLDLSLPDLNGEEVLKEIKHWSSAPVIILTANKTDDDKVKLLDLGADDYLVKPFHAPELLARIRVALRHKNSDNREVKIEIDDFCMDFSARIVSVRNIEVHLTSKEYHFLSILVKNRGKIVTQTQILNEIWGPNNESNSHYLRVYAGQLRKKIEEPLGKKIIYTEAGIGYRLNF